MENLRKKHETEILEIKSPISQTQSTMKGHSSRIGQVEHRLSELRN
jgi:hypothetical protein